MGTFDFDIPEDIFPKSLTDNLEETCMEAIEEAEQIVVEEMKKQIEAAVSDKSTGELVKSIKAGKPKQSKFDGFYGKVGPTGYSKSYYYGGKNKKRKYKLSNAAKLVFIEYGTSKQAARPVLMKIKNNTEKAVINKIQEVINRKVDR